MNWLKSGATVPHRRQMNSRTPARYFMVTASSLVVLLACDPPFDMEGTVSTATGAPVAGAHVAIECPGGSSVDAEATTDGAGRFHTRAIGWQPANCSVRISAPRLANYVTPIMRVCVKRPSHIQNACLSVVIHAVLDAG